MTTLVTRAAPAVDVPPRTPLLPAELLPLLRARVAVALERLDSDDPIEVLAAELELACVCDPTVEPSADGRWHEVGGGF